MVEVCSDIDMAEGPAELEDEPLLPVSTEESSFTTVPGLGRSRLSFASPQAEAPMREMKDVEASEADPGLGDCAWS